MNAIRILQAKNFFLALLPLIVCHVGSVPISPTIPPRSECQVYTPSKPTLHDLGCIRDAFDQIHASLMARNTLLQQQPVSLAIADFQHTMASCMIFESSNAVPMRWLHML